MKIRMKYLFWVIAPSLLIFGAFALRQNSTSEEISIPEIDVVPSRQQLRRSFFQKKEILVVYSATADSLASRYEN
ncbi:MAG: hypothetical protein KJN76_14040, partial [Eudoraea sp.]|nr:hypothetical protein [Eudoraea sp.]